VALLIWLPMPEHITPGVFVEEIPSGSRSIEGVGTSTAGFVGLAESGPSEPSLVTDWDEFVRLYGDLMKPDELGSYMPWTVKGFFENGGKRAYVSRVAAADGRRIGVRDYEAALERLAGIDEIAILCVADDVHPQRGDIASGITAAVIRQCEELVDRFAVIQLPQDAGDGDISRIHPPARSDLAAAYHPWLRVADWPSGATYFVPPGGHVAGVYARTDTTRGVHKAAANEQVFGPVTGPQGEVPLDPEIGELDQDLLNQRGINIIRDFRTMGRGIRVWGARTLSTDPEWKYVAVRRLAVYLEESIQKGTRWVEFEPNVASTWDRVRESIEGFLMTEWRKGALVGSKPEEAFFVKVDRATMTQADIDNGRLVCQVGFAPLRPGEFVIIRIGQKTIEATP